MKKNISINISGIIFHIEEDGYENLQRYLDSINSYFSSYEESEEIIADIESRIAELFLEKLSDGQQVVSAEDVSELIATMGNTSDFEAIEEETDFANTGTSANSTESTGKTTSGAYSGQTGSSSQGTNGKGLFRDLKNQILGGVCAGLAHYMKIDVIWVRVLFLLLLPSGITFIAYFILWIAVPGSDQLEEHESVKKLYRDPDDRVLGGVCSGLAKYLKIDIILLRVIFIIFLIGGGLSFIVYLVLWVITPEASSITDRMQMKGEKVTLSNIDENIKKEKAEEDFGPKDEGLFTKVLLFPFRLIGKILSGLSKALAPLMLFIVAVIRVFTGFIISITGIGMMFGLLVIAGVVLGIYNAEDWYLYESDMEFFPLAIMTEAVPVAGVIAAILIAFVPSLFLTIAGITVIAKRKVMSSSFGWSLLGVWIIAILIAVASVPKIANDFRDESSISFSETLEVSGQTIELDIDDRFNFNRDNSFYIIDLDLRASDDDQVKLESRIHSYGATRSRAEDNARLVEYKYTVRDSVITFEDMFELAREGAFRAQELEMTLYIPIGQQFEIERGMNELMGRFNEGYRWTTAYNNTWVFTENGLECVTCNDRRGDNRGGTSSLNDSGEFRKVIDIDNISELNLKDGFHVTVEKSDDERVIIESSNRWVRDVRGIVSFDELEISGLGMRNSQTRDIDVHIYISELDKVVAHDKVNLELQGFDTNDEIELDIKDEARVKVDGTYATLNVSLIQYGRLTVLGEVDEILAELRGDSRLTAVDSEVRSAKLDTYSDATVRIKVKDYLRVDARGRSVVRYEGNPTLDIINSSTNASVSAF